MATLRELVRGIETVWLVWGLSLFGCFGLAVRWAQKTRLRSLHEVWKGESGLSYTLSFMLTVPLYLMLCCIFFETSLLLLAKLGTVYASYAGARSAIVWESMPSPDMRADRFRQSVVTALAPFCFQARNPGTPPTVPQMSAQLHAEEYVEALETFSLTTVRRAMQLQHFLDVDAKTDLPTVSVQHIPGAELTVVVTYRASVFTPLMAKFLDPDHTLPYEFPISSQTTLNLEYPTSDDGRLGIEYQAF